MIVLCLEGCHGSGKTELYRLLAKKGYNVLDEAFLDMPSYSLHPQSLTMETLWISHWFDRILKQYKPGALFITDRSPYSASFYSKQGAILDPLIDGMIKELGTVQIHIYTVLIAVDKERLWERILARLEREPHRRQYNEANPEWMEKALEFYESRHWDYVIRNDELEVACTQLYKII